VSQHCAVVQAWTPEGVESAGSAAGVAPTWARRPLAPRPPRDALKRIRSNASRMDFPRSAPTADQLTESQSHRVTESQSQPTPALDGQSLHDSAPDERLSGRCYWSTQAHCSGLTVLQTYRLVPPEALAALGWITTSPSGAVRPPPQAIATFTGATSALEEPRLSTANTKPESLELFSSECSASACRGSAVEVSAESKAHTPPSGGEWRASQSESVDSVSLRLC
jgi:hypothetical protein